MDGALLLLIQLLAAVAVGIVVLVTATAWSERRARAKLLRSLGGIIELDDLSRGMPQLFRRTAVQGGRWWKIIQITPFLRGSEQLLEQAGLTWTVRRFTVLIFAGGALGALAGLIFLGPVPGVFGGIAVGMFLPVFYVRRRRAKRTAQIEEQLADAIDLLCRAIRAGHALTTGLRLVAEESPAPLATEFHRVFTEQKYGMRFEEALVNLTRRVNLVDIRVMVVAILIQREVGGNLAEMLDKIANLIRMRFSLRRQMRVHTAQGRMSGYVLGLLPVGLGAVIYLVNPGYIELLFTDPAGRVMLGFALALQVLGYFWISRILKFDF